MEIKTRKHFNEIIKSLTEKILDEEDLDEMTVTSDIAGYNTPFAFDPDGKKKKKDYRSKANSHRKKIGEALEKEDIVKITKLIKVVVGDIIRDIWLKRTTWK